MLHIYMGPAFMGRFIYSHTPGLGVLRILKAYSRVDDRYVHMQGPS